LKKYLHTQPSPNSFAVLSLPMLRQFDVAREKAIAGWLRIVFFLSILFSHSVKVDFSFVDERMYTVWMLTMRDFGAIGFFLLAGASLKGKMLAQSQFKLPGNLVKLAIAAALLAVFDMMFVWAKGGVPGSLSKHFYDALYDTNLWFFVAYSFAGPLLLSLDRRTAGWTAVCCLLFIMFPANPILLSPYILQTISLAFVCMVIGAELHGRLADSTLALVVAAAAFLARISLDDFGAPAYPAVDIVLRIAYGVACFQLFKAIADTVSLRVKAPGWANYLFVPYVVQFPILKVMLVICTALFTQSIDIKMPPVFFSYWWSLSFMLTIFVFSAVVSFAIAWVLHRHEIRV